MFKKCTVVILPTNEKAVYKGQLVTGAGNNLFASRKADNIGSLTSYHLYFLSDDAIKIDDWMYHKLDEKPVLANKQTIDNEDLRKYAYKKIITTTNPSLVSYHEIGGGSLPLPSPSQSFIELYVSEYNAGRKIESVMVEYVEMAISGIVPVIKNDNTINIKLIKDSWNREEVIRLCTAAFFHKDVKKGLPYDYNDSSLDKWIESNL